MQLQPQEVSSGHIVQQQDNVKPKAKSAHYLYPKQQGVPIKETQYSARKIIILSILVIAAALVPLLYLTYTKSDGEGAHIQSTIVDGIPLDLNLSENRIRSVKGGSNKQTTTVSTSRSTTSSSQSTYHKSGTQPVSRFKSFSGRDGDGDEDEDKKDQEERRKQFSQSTRTELISSQDSEEDSKEEESILGKHSLSTEKTGLQGVSQFDMVHVSPQETILGSMGTP